MHYLLLQCFKESEKLRKQLLADLKTIGPSDKFFDSPPGKWSISQILTHLIQAERLSLEYMKKKSLGIESAGNTGLIEEIKFQILLLSQELPLKYKAPPVLGNRPAELQYDVICSEWDLLRAQLGDFLNTIADHHVRRKIYKHPVMGRLNVTQAVRFFDAHLKHHHPQIKRLL